MNLSIIGGDLRIVRLAQMYANEGNKVYTYGLEKYFKENSMIKDNMVSCKKISDVFEKTNYIISGVPFSKDKEHINMPFSDDKIRLDEFKDLLFNTKTKKFFAGGITKDYYQYKEEKKCTNTSLIDLLEIEELTILNAIPTVEGTIKIAIDEREETIHESNVLVCGFGRIGKILCDRFSKLGACVYCAARKDSDLAWIREKGHMPLTYSEIANYSNKINIVINTVPHMVIGKEILKTFNANILIIDLASSPGGVDTKYAKEIGIKAITALGIPGKEMPKTAAKYIKEVVDNIINQKKN